MSDKNSLPTVSFQGRINNIETDVVCSAFSDQNFIMISHFRKIGTLIRVTINNISDNRISSELSFSTKVLCGNDEDYHHIFARTIAQCLTKRLLDKAKKNGADVDHKPILCSLALKDYSKDTLKEICQVFEQKLIHVF